MMGAEVELHVLKLDTQLTPKIKLNTMIKCCACIKAKVLGIATLSDFQ